MKTFLQQIMEQMLYYTVQMYMFNTLKTVRWQRGDKLKIIQQTVCAGCSVPVEISVD